MLCCDPAAAYLAALPSRIFRLFGQPFKSAMTTLSFVLPLLAHGVFLRFCEALPLCMFLLHVKHAMQSAGNKMDRRHHQRYKTSHSSSSELVRVMTLAKLWDHGTILSDMACDEKHLLTVKKQCQHARQPCYCLILGAGSPSLCCPVLTSIFMQ